MSQDMRTTLTLEELGDAIEIRRYRLGFGHALALSAAVILILAAASGAFTLVRPGEESVLPYEPDLALAEPRSPAPREPFADTSAGPTPDLWSRAKDYGGELWSSFARAAGSAGRIRLERQLTQAFADLDQSDPQQLRAFLAAHKDDPYAEELGYLPAARRAIGEQRVFRTGDIVRCGDCWCWTELPVPTNDATVTQ